MTLYAFDGVSAFSLSAAKAAGGIVATVYIVGSPGDMPHADAARVAAIRAAGMGALPNWERAADFFGTCTVAQAQAAGAEALAACKALGFPSDGSVTVPFSFDFDIPSSRFPEMLTKLKAVQTGITSAYRACAYGPQGLIDYLAAHGWPGKHWLMMSTFGHAYSADDSHAFMVQEHRSTGEWLNSPVAGTDINTILDPHALGAWWPDGSPYATGVDVPLDPNDPVIVELNKKLDSTYARIWQCIAIAISGDAAHPYNLASEGPTLAAIQKSLATLAAAASKPQTATVAASGDIPVTGTLHYGP